MSKLFTLTLMRYARDKAFDRIMKFEKGKSTKRTSAIMNCHKASLLLPTTLVHAESNNQWTVQSSTEANTTYTVEKVANDSCQNCWMQCHICQVCVKIWQSGKLLSVVYTLQGSNNLSGKGQAPYSQAVKY